MKNFDQRDLRLINTCPHLTSESYKWAVGASDLLEKAKLFTKLSDALSDISTSVAFTRRLGHSRRKHLDLKNSPEWMAEKASRGKLAFVFGREDSGLTNEEVNLCDATITIHTSPTFSSLNLSQAVLIACQELFSLRSTPDNSFEEKLVSHGEIATLMKRLSKMLDILEYKDTEEDKLHTKILRRFDKIFGRAGLTYKDIKMFEGLTARILSKPSK